MNTIRLSITTMMIFTIGAAVFATEPTDEQKEKFTEIEQYIKTQKQCAEYRFDEQLAVVREQMNTKLLPLDVGDNRKTLTGGFLGWTEFLQEVLLLDGIDLRNDKEFMSVYEYFKKGRLRQAVKLDQSPKLMAIAERRLADAQSRVMAQLAVEHVQLNEMKKYTIETQLPELEEKLKENVLNSPKESPEGVVNGIVWSQDKPTAIVGSQIVHKGERIGKVRIVQIRPDSVKFSRGKRQWVQKVGDEKAAGW